MANLIERFFSSREAMQRSLLANTEYQIEKAIQLQGKATIMLSGGSTPKPLYQSLANTNLSWQQVTIGMVDERWVNSDSDASNESFIRLNLLNRIGQKPQFITMKTEQSDHFSAELEVEKKYQSLNQIDLTILGMGNDGHTASLFPGAKGIDKALSNSHQLCAAIDAIPSQVTGQYTQRMTLTLSALKKSKLINLLLVGQDKLDTYRQALAGSDIDSMPIRAILHQTQAPVVVYWAA